MRRMILPGTVTAHESPIVVRATRAAWEVWYRGNLMTVAPRSNPAHEDLAIRLAAQAAHTLSDHFKVSKVDVQCTPEEVERFKRIAFAPTITLMNSLKGKTND